MVKKEALSINKPIRRRIFILISAVIIFGLIFIPAYNTLKQESISLHQSSDKSIQASIATTLSFIEKEEKPEFLTAQSGYDLIADGLINKSLSRVTYIPKDTGIQSNVQYQSTSLQLEKTSSDKDTGASRGTSHLLLFWDGVIDAPSNWTCLSCSPGDPFYQRFPRGNDSYGATGGLANHTHTISLLSHTQGASVVMGGTSSAKSSATHTHDSISSTFVSAESNLPQYRNLKIIMYDYGIPDTIPEGVIAIFNSSSLPDGWTRYSSQDNYFVRGEGSINTGGSNTHAHTVSYTLDTSSDTETGGGSGTAIAQEAHIHTVTDTSDSVDHRPPYLEVILAKADSDTSIPYSTSGVGMIAMFNGTPPLNWDVVSSTGDDFFQRFIVGNTVYGGTGGNSSHNHPDLTSTSSVPDVTTEDSGTGKTMADDDHTHDVTISFSPNVSHLPPYRDVIFAYAEDSPNSPPTIPTNITFDGSDDCNITISGVVEVNASGSTDPDDNITYYIEALLENVTTAQNTTDTDYMASPGSIGGGFVLSVERVDITIADGSTTNTAVLTKGQNISNCVPFATDQRSTDVSSNGDSDNYAINNVDIEIYDDSGTPTVRARNFVSTDTVIVTVYIVEFDESVDVQSGTFTLSGATSTTESISSVDLDQTALVFYYRADSTGDADDYSEHTVRGNFTSSTQLGFYKQDSATDITGHWYLFEDLADNYDVQHRDFTLSSTSATATINSVLENKTFTIASYETTQTSDDPGPGTIRVDLQDDTTIRAIRYSTGGTITVTTHAITFTGNEFVQRGFMSFPATGTGELQQTDTINSVDMNMSIAWSPVRFLASSSCGEGSTSSSDNSAHQVRVYLTDNTTVQATRDNYGDSPVNFAWEVIEFAVSGGDSGESNETNTTYTTYADVNGDYDSITNISVTIEVDSYDPSASVQQSTNKPDLELDIWNGSNWTTIGTFNLPNIYTGSGLDSTNHNFTLTTTNPALLAAWMNSSHQDVRIRGISMDYYNDTTIDMINYTNLWIEINGKKWTVIGNHTEDSSLNWDTSQIPEQDCVNFRARAIDLTGSNTYSEYYTRSCCMNLRQNLIITKTDNLDPILAGSILNYTILIYNIGATNLTNITIVEAYDTNVMFNNSNPSPTTGDNTWIFPILNSNETIIIDITVNVSHSLPDGTVLNNFANVTCDQGLYYEVRENTLVRGANISISKSDEIDPVQAGDTLNYTIWVNNTGYVNLTNVTVVETYDADVLFNSSIPSPSSGNNNWVFPNLNVSESKKIDISVNVTTDILNGSILTNYAQVTCDEGVFAEIWENTTVESDVTIKVTVTKEIAPQDCILCETSTIYINVTAEGEPYVIEKPACVMLLVDTSSSMVANTYNGSTILEYEKNALLSFVNNINYSRDKVGIATFNTTGQLILPLTNDIDAISNAINGLSSVETPTRYTNTGEGIYVASQELYANCTNESVNVIIVFTDGIPTRPFTPHEPCPPPADANSPYALAQANNSKDNGTIMITIGFLEGKRSQCGNDTVDFAYDLLRNIATNESYFYSAVTPEDFEEIYLNLTYTISDLALIDAVVVDYIFANITILDNLTITNTTDGNQQITFNRTGIKFNETWQLMTVISIVQLALKNLKKYT